MIRPWISRSPRVSRSCSASGASWWAPGGSRRAALLTARSRVGVGGGAAEAVGARAQVAGRVQRTAAEGARLPARGDDSLGALAEGACKSGRQAYDEHLLRLRLDDLLLRGPRVDDGLVAVGEHFDHDPL